MGIREILLKRVWLIFSIVLSLITGIVIGYSLKSEPFFSNVLGSLGLSLAWLINMIWGVFREARQNEQDEEQERIRQEEFLVNDLNNWMDKTQFGMLSFKEGILEDRIHVDPDSSSLMYYDEVVKILEKCKIYSFWVEGKEKSTTFLKEGKNAIHDIQMRVNKATKNVPLKKSLKQKLLNEPCFIFPNIVKSIFNEVEDKIGITVQRPRESSISGYFPSSKSESVMSELCHGTFILAYGKIEVLNILKEIVENLILNEKIRKQIGIYKENENKLESKDVFKEFERKLNKLIKDWERFHEFRTQT
jgi:hypothetical protein